MTTQTAPEPTPVPDTRSIDLDAVEGAIRSSTFFAWLIIAGLPLAGLIAALWLSLPTFACLMSGCFLLAAGLTCHKAVAAFTGKTLRLLVTARLVLVLVLASLLLIATGAIWTSLVSGVLIWLVADRLLGRAALRDLVELTRER